MAALPTRGGLLRVERPGRGTPGAGAATLGPVVGRGWPQPRAADGQLAEPHRARHGAGDRTAPYPLYPRKVFRPGSGPIPDEAVPSLAFGDASRGTSTSQKVGARATSRLRGTGPGVGPRSSATAACHSWSIQWEFPAEIVSETALPSGRHLVAIDSPRSATGTSEVRMSVDGNPAGGGTLPAGTVTNGQADGTALRLGHDAGFPVSDVYQPPFPWTGTLHHVVVESLQGRPSPPRRGRIGRASGLSPLRSVRIPIGGASHISPGASGADHGPVEEVRIGFAEHARDVGKVKSPKSSLEMWPCSTSSHASGRTSR